MVVGGVTAGVERGGRRGVVVVVVGGCSAERRLRDGRARRGHRRRRATLASFLSAFFASGVLLVRRSSCRRPCSPGCGCRGRLRGAAACLSRSASCRRRCPPPPSVVGAPPADCGVASPLLPESDFGLSAAAGPAEARAASRQAAAARALLPAAWDLQSGSAQASTCRRSVSQAAASRSRPKARSCSAHGRRSGEWRPWSSQRELRCGAGASFVAAFVSGAFPTAGAAATRRVGTSENGAPTARPRACLRAPSC